MKRKVWLVGKDEKRKSWLRKGQLCGGEDTEDPVSHKGREGEGGASDLGSPQGEVDRKVETPEHASSESGGIVGLGAWGKEEKET